MLILADGEAGKGVSGEAAERALAHEAMQRERTEMPSTARRLAAHDRQAAAGDVRGWPRDADQGTSTGFRGMTAGSARLLLRRWPYSLVSSWPAITGISGCLAWVGASVGGLAVGAETRCVRLSGARRTRCRNQRLLRPLGCYRLVAIRPRRLR